MLFKDILLGTGCSATIKHRCVTHLYGSNAIEMWKCENAEMNWNGISIIQYRIRYLVRQYFMNKMKTKFSIVKIVDRKTAIKSYALQGL